MPDPTLPPEGQVFGIKFGLSLAGFAGGIVSLSFLKNLTPLQGFLSVFTGTASANYLTSPLASYFHIDATGDGYYGLGFIVGLTAMNLIPGFLKLSEIFKRDPRAFIGGGGAGGDK